MDEPLPDEEPAPSVEKESAPRESGVSPSSTTGGGWLPLTLLGSGGETSHFVDDIIYSTGSFVQWPEGKQE